MFRPPNAHSLGADLTRRIAAAAATAKRSSGEDQSGIVILQRGAAGRTPILCIPGAGASVWGFNDLCGFLDPAQPVHGLQPCGLDGTSVPRATVQAAAESFAREVRRRIAPGPVHLLGHSFGGWVAFEMAPLLAEAGLVVRSLTMVDTEVPHQDAAEIIERDTWEAFRSFVAAFEQTYERSLGIGQQQIDSLDEEQLIGLLHDRLVALGVMPRKTAPHVLRGPFHTFSRCTRTTYSPTAVSEGDVRLVLVSDPSADEAENLRRFARARDGWARWAPHLTCHVAPGNHMTVLNRPHVAGIAALLGDGAPGTAPPDT